MVKAHEKQNREIVAFIDGRLKAIGSNREELATKTHMSRATLNRRMASPETFTLTELRRVLDYFRATDEQKLSMI